MLRLPAALLLAPLFLSAANAQDDWTQFRGSRRDSVWGEKGLLETFPPEGVKVRWRVPVGGGFSSPVVSQGRVYLIDSSVQKPKAWEQIRCLDEKTGAALWTHREEAAYTEDWQFDPEAKWGPNSTPVVHAGKLFALGALGDLLSLDAAQGTLLWKRNLLKDYGPATQGFTPSPLIEGDLLILLPGAKPDGCVIAFDKNSGKEVWRALDDKWTHSSPIVIDAGGKRQLIVWTGEAVTSLDPATGKIWWRETHELQGNYNVVTAPVVSGDLLLVGGMMFRLAADKPAATLLWPKTMAASSRVLSFTSMPLIQGEYLYSDRWTGTLVCMSTSTGKVVWKSNKITDIRGGATIHLVPNGDAVWIFTDQGNLIRSRLTPEGYQELSRTHLLDPSYLYSGRKVVWAPPAFADRHIFARNEKELLCASLAADQK